MRHALSFSDLAGARVGVLGLGVEGRAVRDRLLALSCELVLVDDRPEQVDDPDVRSNDKLGRAALRSCVAVVKAPGISRYRDDVTSLEAAGVPVLGGVGMWLEEADRERVVCVTGTKGKSTVATVIGHLAERLGTPSAVVGNLGLPPFAPGVELAGRLVVVETSSFQATDVAHSPAVVAVTSLGDDHLDWHRSAAAYHADKLSLTSQPGARCTVVADTPLLREHGALIGGEPTWVGEGDERLATALGLAGAHGARNAAVAVATLRALGVEGTEDDDRLEAAAGGYEVLKGRFREIARRGEVRFIDDSLATNPLPTIAAIDAVGAVPLAIIVGGHDRGVNYDGLVNAVGARDLETLVVTLPDNGPRLGARITRRTNAEVRDVADVREAVEVAAAWIGEEGVVLLSPAAPSFSQFRNWEERSDAYAAAVGEVLSRP